MQATFVVGKVKQPVIAITRMVADIRVAIEQYVIGMLQTTFVKISRLVVEPGD